MARGNKGGLGQLRPFSSFASGIRDGLGNGCVVLISTYSFPYSWSVTSSCLFHCLRVRSFRALTEMQSNYETVESTETNKLGDDRLQRTGKSVADQWTARAACTLDATDRLRGRSPEQTPNATQSEAERIPGGAALNAAVDAITRPTVNVLGVGKEV